MVMNEFHFTDMELGGLLPKTKCYEVVYLHDKTAQISFVIPKQLSSGKAPVYCTVTCCLDRICVFVGL